VAGLAATMGSGAMTNSLAEIAGAACILAIGSNTTKAHPIAALEVKRAARNGAKLIVANPKKIDLCRHAHLFLQHRPGSDVALVMGMANVILEEKLWDEEFVASRCEGLEALRASAAEMSPARAESLTGVPRERIAEAARCFASSRPASILYAMGITQSTHGTDNVKALSNLALLTGNVGKPSAGVNPLRGQNNVQGACDMGALPNVFPGYRPVSDPEARRAFEAAWGVALDGAPGLTHTEIFHAAHAGEIRALYLVGENPLLSEADASVVDEALGRLEFLVVQDIFLTETAKRAHVVLPAAAFAEKDGTFTNTERRVQRVRLAVPPPGEARPDSWITCQIARRMGARGFDFGGPEDVFREIASLTPSYRGLTYERLEPGPLTWPCPSPDHPGTPILHTLRFATPDGKARLVPIAYRPPAEQPDAEFPFVLTTDRGLFHFHTGTMSRRVKGFERLDGQERLLLNPRDAQALGVGGGDTVRVRSRRGSVVARAGITENLPPGLVSLTFHFAETPTNLLTNGALDPVAKIPETKFCAVRVEKT